MKPEIQFDAVLVLELAQGLPRHRYRNLGEAVTGVNALVDVVENVAVPGDDTETPRS